MNNEKGSYDKNLISYVVIYVSFYILWKNKLIIIRNYVDLFFFIFIVFKVIFNCVEDNCFVLKCMGYIGVVVIFGIFVIILFLDVKFLILCR